MHDGRQCREVLLEARRTSLGSGSARGRHAVLLRPMIFQFDLFCLAIETVGQIGQLQTARIIPR